MQEQEIQVDVEERGRILLVKVYGSLEISRLKSFKSSLDPLFEGEITRHVLIDCRELDHLSSKAIGLLTVYAKICHAAHRELAMSHVNDHIKAVLGMLGTLALFPLYDTQEEGLDALNRLA